MVTRQNTINMINFASDAKLTILVSNVVRSAHYSVQDLDAEDIITILIAHFSNSPRIAEIEQFVGTAEMQGYAIDYIVEMIIEHFDQDEQFIENIRVINQQRTYLLEQANLLADGHATLEHLVNLVEANDSEGIIDGIIRQYFRNNVDIEIIRWLLGRELGVDLRDDNLIRMLSENQVEELITNVHNIVGEVNDPNGPLGIANRVINGANVYVDDSMSEISTDEFISMMRPGIRPAVETDLVMVDFDDNANHSSYKADNKESKSSGASSKYSSADSKYLGISSAFSGVDSKVFYRGHFRDDEDFGEL